MTTSPEPIERQDIEAVLAVRRELAASYDAALVDSFAERVEAAITARVDAQVAERERVRKLERSRTSNQLTLGIVSLGCGIPITAIGGGIGHLPGIGVVWGGIALVNLANAIAARGRR